jgi:peptidoglycan-associated lipoprotein
MKLSKVVLVGLLIALLAGCSCKTKGIGDGNIDDGSAGGPLKDVNFAFDSYKLDSKAKGISATNAEWLKANPEAKARVEGHCDERGTNEYNMALGANRARAVHEYLKSLGISADRLSTVSYGEEMPLDPGHNEAAWAANRRVHHNVTK